MRITDTQNLLEYARLQGGRSKTDYIFRRECNLDQQGTFKRLADLGYLHIEGNTIRWAQMGWELYDAITKAGKATETTRRSWASISPSMLLHKALEICPAWTILGANEYKSTVGELRAYFRGIDLMHDELTLEGEDLEFCELTKGHTTALLKYLANGYE